MQEVKITSSTGFSNKLTNSGNVTNEGLEFTLNATPISTKDWHWDLNGNLAFNKNKIGGLNGDQFANTLWYGADNEAEVRADPQYTYATDATVKSKIGEIKYLDINHDGKITDADRTIIGDTNPKYSWGLTNNISWRDLNRKSYT